MALRAWIRAHRVETTIWVIFIALAATYSVVTPLFEAPDEIYHVAVIDHIADTGRLPVQRPGVETLWEQEGSQPPLYYLIGAALVRGIDRSNLEAILRRNPHAHIGNADPADNKNAVIHTEAEAFPWQRTALAAHVLRFLSMALGAITVALVYPIARLAAPDHPRLPALAMALTAFNPTFVFISGAVNNDNLNIALTTTALLLILLLLRDGLRARWVFALSAVLALASLSKISGLAFYPLAVLVMLLVAVRGPMQRGTARRAPTGQSLWRVLGFPSLTLIVAWIVIAGWWYWRNLALYGEPLGLQTMIAIAGPRDPVPSYLDLLAEFEGFRFSYWAMFGWFNVLADKLFYLYADLLTLAAVIGLAWWIYRKARARDGDTLLPVALLMLQAGVVALGVMSWTRQTPATQGRLMFPIIAGISALLALGLTAPLRPNWRRIAGIAAAAPLFIAAVISPFAYIMPAYSLPPPVDGAPSGAHPVEVRWGPIELLAYRVHEDTAYPGGTVPVTLYWRADEPVAEDYSLYLHLLGREYAEVGKIDTYPGRGLLPTSRWTPGAVIADTYRLPIDPEAQTPTAQRLAVGWWRYPDESTYLIAADSAGNALPSVILPASRLVAHDYAKPPPLPHVPGATFGGAFALRGYEALADASQPGGAFDVTLYWESLIDSGEEFTVFVHLLDADGQIRGQGDGPPVRGDYPTSLWLRGQWIEDTHTVTIDPDAPPGKYTLAVGLYRPGDGSRLEARDANAARPPDDAFILRLPIVIGQP